MANRFSPPRKATHADHSVIYRNEREFSGWPFYCGLWKTADGSLVASFKRVPNSYGTGDEVNHGQMVGKGALWVIRSRDNGRSWDQSSFQAVWNMNVRAEAEIPGGAVDYSAMKPLDFKSRDTLIMCGAMPGLLGPQSRAWLRASADGGRTWRPPMMIALDNFPSLTATGSSMYATREDGMHLLGVTTVGPDLPQRAMIYGCMDGANWHFLSFVTPERPGEQAYYSVKTASPFTPLTHFYTRPLVLRDGGVLATVRYQRDARNVIWTEMWGSEDGGRSWDYRSRVTDWGAPGDIVEMADGRIVCVYGYRMMLSGIRYRVSQDRGRTWGSEMILRDDGGSWDVGYPRVIEHEKGKLLAIYYMNTKSDPIQQDGGVRHIAQTIFEP
jgi:hypothetical protein